MSRPTNYRYILTMIAFFVVGSVMMPLLLVTAAIRHDAGAIYVGFTEGIWLSGLTSKTWRNSVKNLSNFSEPEPK